MSHPLRVAVLRGGPSSEYEVSLNTGANVLGALRQNFAEKYRPHDILIDQAGAWHRDGMPISIEDVCRMSDVVFNGLHGAYGEDGKVQQIFEVHGLPFTGSYSLGSAISMNKMLTKRSFRDHGIVTPTERVIASDLIVSNMQSLMAELFQTLILPVVVKPVSSGSSVGVSMARWYKELPQALLKAAQYGDAVIVEEFIQGLEATCGVIEDYRNEEVYALPPVEIRPHAGFFDYQAKYEGKSDEIVPATFSEKIKHSIQEMARKIHQALGLRHYSRSDFIIHPRRGIYALEVNTLPGLTAESLMPKALRAIGSDTSEFVDHVIQLAVR